MLMQTKIQGYGSCLQNSFVQGCLEKKAWQNNCGVLLKHVGKVLMLAGFLEKFCLWKSVQTDWNRDLRSSHGVGSTILWSKLPLSFS